MLLPFAACTIAPSDASVCLVTNRCRCSSAACSLWSSCAERRASSRTLACDALSTAASASRTVSDKRDEESSLRSPAKDLHITECCCSRAAARARAALRAFAVAARASRASQSAACFVALFSFSERSFASNDASACSASPRCFVISSACSARFIFNSTAASLRSELSFVRCAIRSADAASISFASRACNFAAAPVRWSAISCACSARHSSSSRGKSTSARSCVAFNIETSASRAACSSAADAERLFFSTTWAASSVTSRAFAEVNSFNAEKWASTATPCARRAAALSSFSARSFASNDACCSSASPLRRSSSAACSLRNRCNSVVASRAASASAAECPARCAALVSTSARSLASIDECLCSASSWWRANSAEAFARVRSRTASPSDAASKNCASSSVRC